MDSRTFDFFVYDYGLEIACSVAGIDTGQAESVLFHRPDKLPGPFRFQESKEPSKEVQLSPDHHQLAYFLGEIYEMIQDRFLAGSRIVNRRSMTRYDEIMESIVRLLSESADFVYRTDIETCEYIWSRLDKFMNTEMIRTKRAGRIIRFDNLGEIALSLMGFVTDPDPDDLTEMMEILRHQSDPETIVMIILRSKGYSEQEIGQQFSCSQGAVNKRINIALEIMKTA